MFGVQIRFYAFSQTLYISFEIRPNVKIADSTWPFVSGVFKFNDVFECLIKVKNKESKLFSGDMQQLARVLVLIVACAVHALHCMECEPNQNEQSTSFFETSGDLSLTGK